MVGHYLAGYNLVVPPNTDSFDIFGTCKSNCLSGVSDKRSEESTVSGCCNHS